MPSCVIIGCKNSSCFQNKSLGITFHKFPTDITWKQKWIVVVRDNRNDVEWLPSKFCVICSLHFDEIDIYNTKGGYRRIKKNAIPKRIHLVNSQWCQGMEASDSFIIPQSSTVEPNTEHCEVKEEVDTAGISGETSDKNTEDISESQDIILNYHEEICDSELESIFDTPKTHKLRQQARKYKLRNKIYARKIKTLDQKVKRLKKKNASLKTIIKDLKDKNYKLRTHSRD